MSLFSLVASLSLDSTEYSRGLSDAENQIRNTANAIKTNADAAKKALETSGGGAKTFGEKIADAGKNVSALGDKIKAVSKPLADLGANLTKTLTVPIVGAFTAGTKSAIDFEGGLKKAYTIADESKVPYDEMAAAIKNLSKESGVGLGELTDGLYSALSASVDTENSVDFLTTAINLSKAGFLETEGAVDVLTTALNAYGRSADDARLIADQLVLTQNDGKTTVDELASSMGMVIPTAAALNVPLEQLTAAYAQMTKQGINTANATTNLNGMMSELADGGSTVGEILKEKTGKTFGELEAEGKSLGDVLGILSDSVDGNSEDFLNLWGNVRAGRGALSLLNGGIDEYNAEVEKMENATGQVDGALETLEGTGTSLKKALNQLVLVGEDIGERFAPYVQKAADKLKELLDKWDSLDQDTQDMIIKIALVVAAVGPVISIIAGVGTAVGTVMSILGGLTTFVGATLIPGIAAIAPVAAPLLAGGAVILGVAAGAIFLMQHWDQIKEKAGEVKEAVVEKWNNLKEGVGTAVENLKTSVSEKWSNIKTAVGNTVENIKTGASNKWNEIKTNVGNTVETLKTSIADKWTAVKTNASDTWNNIKTNVSNTVNTIKTNISDKIEAAKTAAANKLDAIKTKFTDIFDNIKSHVSGVVDWLKNVFDFHWELPHIKLPHFSITGSFSLNPPSVPHFSIDWYKKAYEMPYLFTDPTIFGGAGFGDGADPGGELVYGKTALMEDIKKAVGSEKVFAPVINVYATAGQDVEELAQKIMDRMEFEYRRAGAVFGT